MSILIDSTYRTPKAFLKSEMIRNFVRMYDLAISVNLFKEEFVDFENKKYHLKCFSRIFKIYIYPVFQTNSSHENLISKWLC